MAHFGYMPTIGGLTRSHLRVDPHVPSAVRPSLAMLAPPGATAKAVRTSMAFVLLRRNAVSPSAAAPLDS